MLEIEKHPIFEQIQIVPLNAFHLNDIVELHSRILWWSFNGRFGREHIYALYEALVTEKNAFGYVCYVNGKLHGFITATVNSQETRKAVQKVYASKALRVIWELLKSPKALMGVLESKFSVPRVFKKFNCNAEWLTFVCDTDSAFITPFVAKKLMRTLDQGFTQRGVSLFMAQGIKDNPTAMKYYQALNWKIETALPMHNIYSFSGGAWLGK